MKRAKSENKKFEITPPRLFDPFQKIESPAVKIAHPITQAYSQLWGKIAEAIAIKKKRIKIYNLDDFDPLELFPEKNNKYKDYIHIIERLKQGPATLHELSKKIETKEYVSRKKFKEISYYRKTTKMRIYALRKKLKEDTGFRIVLKESKYVLKNIYVPNSENSLE